MLGLGNSLTKNTKSDSKAAMAKEIVNAFKLRVLADDGVFEAENCLILQIKKLL
jgi:hypothetical protein